MATFVLLGEGGARIARAITADTACPAIVIDGQSAPMSLRAPPGIMPLRPTQSATTLSKPSAFQVSTCEATIPPGARSARIGARDLPLPPTRITRIVVIGDTGCRLKAADQAFQACNDLKAYPFARIAAAAARWKPDLVIHVGDYLYRENPCPAGDQGCAGSPWGYGYDAWSADLFEPAQPLLSAAAWAAARGNHESCIRAGQGWWRFIDPRPLVAGRDCNDAANDPVGDYSAPYAVPISDGAQIILFDSAAAPVKPLKPGDLGWDRFRDTYGQIAELARKAPHNILIDHHPLLAFAATRSKQGDVELRPAAAGLQSAFGSVNPQLVPGGIDLLLSGHIHVWEALSFAPPYPAQIVAGFSGTQEDLVPLPPAPPNGQTPAPGAVVQAMSSWVDGFGFMTLTRQSADRWLAEVRDQDGAVVNTCQIAGAHLTCALAQVSHP